MKMQGEKYIFLSYLCFRFPIQVLIRAKNMQLTGRNAFGFFGTSPPSVELKNGTRFLQVKHFSRCAAPKDILLAHCGHMRSLYSSTRHFVKSELCCYIKRSSKPTSVLNKPLVGHWNELFVLDTDIVSRAINCSWEVVFNNEQFQEIGYTIHRKKIYKHNKISNAILNNANGAADSKNKGFTSVSRYER